MKLLLAAIAVAVAGVGAGAARADAPPQELAGQPFYFAATCTALERHANGECTFTGGALSPETNRSTSRSPCPY